MAGLSARMSQALAAEMEKAELARQFKIDLATTPNPTPNQSSVLNTTQAQYTIQANPGIAAGATWAIGPDPDIYTSTLAQTVDPATLLAQIRQAQTRMRAAQPATKTIPDMFSGELAGLANTYLHYMDIPWLPMYDDPDDDTPSVAQSAEHAYQASKTPLWNEQQWLLHWDDPFEVKRRGMSSAITVHPLWDRGLRVRYMMKILNLKFAPGSDLGDLLVNTTDMFLRNTNTIHDQFWGDCVCTGHYGTPGTNMLGELLMVRRETLRLLT